MLQVTHYLELKDRYGLHNQAAEELMDRQHRTKSSL